MGYIYEDYGDVVFRAMKHYASCPRVKERKGRGRRRSPALPPTEAATMIPTTP